MMKDQTPEMTEAARDVDAAIHVSLLRNGDPQRLDWTDARSAVLRSQTGEYTEHKTWASYVGRDEDRAGVERSWCVELVRR